MSSARRQLAASLRMLLVLTLLLGVLYPAAVWVVGRVAFPGQADGSLVRRDGVVIGSSLLGQKTANPSLFQGRPSVSDSAGDVSGGSNLAATDRRQRVAVTARSKAYAAANGGASAPADALTASASGLDPDISVADAQAQAPRVGRANGLPLATILRLVREHTQGRSWGFLGEPRVNVLELNLAVQAQGTP